MTNASMEHSAKDAPRSRSSDHARGRIGIRDFCLIALQVGAVIAVIWKFDIEQSYGLKQILPIVFGGFLVHAWLPIRLRHPAFLLLSLGAILTILGPAHGALLISVGFLFIGICHLPIPMIARVAILTGLGAVAAALRAGWITAPSPSIATVVVPALAAIFMFRIAIYLYDLSYEKSPASLWERLSYFFLLPNICFLLFPVVDYRTFCRTYYDKPAYAIYQKGVLWMMRGVVHLLLYRLVYYHFSLAPWEVTDLGTMVHYMVSVYLLYLHISGQFHLIVGMLCLFGFNLPETHHLFYLSSGFNDLWRRINIYWKDFMMKLVYYPALMRIRGLGMTAGMVIATIITFLGTWFLHAYQWFWLRGDFLLKPNDALFWSILGTFVVINSLMEARKGRKRRLGKRAWDPAGALIHSLKVVCMFTTMTVLWTFWNSAGTAEFLAIVSAAGNSGIGSWMLLFAGLLALVGIGFLVQMLNHRGIVFASVGNAPAPHRALIGTLSTAVALLLLGGGLPFFGNWGGPTHELVQSLRKESLNRIDQDQMERGYYESLLDMGGYTSALARIQGQKPKEWLDIYQTDAVQTVDGVLEFELVPSKETIFKDAPMRTNRWGMRDKDYSLAKPPGTDRMAMLGASYEMGSGVRDNESYEAIVEDRINTHPPKGFGAHLEILNFSVGAYGMLHQVALLESKVLKFNPDSVMLILHSTEHKRMVRHLQNLVEGGVKIPYPDVRDIVAKAGVSSEMDRSETYSRLMAVVPEVIHWSIQEIGRKLHAAGITPIAVYVPATKEGGGIETESRDQLMAWARESGFFAYQIENPFVGEDLLSFQLAPWDTHPNVKGHARIAEELHKLFVAHPEEFLKGRPPKDGVAARSPDQSTEFPSTDN